MTDLDLYEADMEPELYETGCKHCGDDRRQRRAGACIDCTDPSEWFDDDWSLNW